MLQKTRGIILHYIKYSESSIIVHIYTELYGRKSFICSGIKNKRSNNKLSFFQPLSLIEMECYFKSKNEINRIKEIRTDIPLYHISGDVRKSSIALFISEILYRTLIEEESNPDMYKYLYNSIQILENLENGISNFHLVFILHYIRYLGIFPHSDFDDLLRNNELISKIHDNRTEERYFNALTVKIKNDLAKLYNTSFNNLDELIFNHKERFNILEVLINYMKLHFSSIDNIKSLVVLKEVFNNE